MIDKNVYEKAEELLEACSDAGLDPLVTSTYRSPLRQAWLLIRKTAGFLIRRKKPTEAWRSARKLVALPGKSEHEMGAALDVCSKQRTEKANAEVQRWHADNSWRYGFVQRYPENKSNLTGIAYEPWHFRYVGQKAAAKMKAKGQCLKECLDHLKQAKAHANGRAAARPRMR